MRIYLSSLDCGYDILDEFEKRGVKDMWNLVSFFHPRTMNHEWFERLLSMSESVIVDSGAFSLQHGQRVDIDEYLRKYAAFINENDNEKILGFFEMDIDSFVGYEKVKQMRTKLDRVTDKIVPVWHKNRGVEDFKRMCDETPSRMVAVGCVHNLDIRIDQYINFVNEAHRRGCKIHGLGMTNMRVLKKVPFDTVDSTSWNSKPIRGINPKTGKKGKGREFYIQAMANGYMQWVQKQKEMELFWKRKKN